MIFLRYPSFPSDAVLALATAGATLTLMDTKEQTVLMPMTDFLAMTMDQFTANSYLLLSVSIPANSWSENIKTAAPASLSASVLVSETFKIAQRNKNAHAYVNAGFQFQISPAFAFPADHSKSPAVASASGPLCTNARIVIGGVSKKTFLAVKTMSVLRNSRWSCSFNGDID